MSGDQVNFISYHMTAGGSPQSVGLPGGACRVIVKAVQGYVGVAQYGTGSWTPEKVSSMSGDNDYLGATLAEGDVLDFRMRAAQTPDGLYVASLEATNPSIASVTIIPE